MRSKACAAAPLLAVCAALAGGPAPVLAAAPAVSCAAEAGPTAAQDAVRFTVTEGRNLNSFLRQGPVAAHLLLRSGRDARILVAFPAGNSGVGLWFAQSAAPVRWRLIGEPRPVVLQDAKGRPLCGVEADLEADAGELKPKAAVLSAVRVLRDYQKLGTQPASVAVAPRIEGNRISWARDRLDGAAGYRLELTVTDGSIADGRLIAGRDGKIGLRLTALSGETPLNGLSGASLLNDKAHVDPQTQKTLEFLSYKDKFLAGSWRFDTYFGRDTLMSVRLLMPALQPEAVEGGLRSVLARLSPGGEAAHREDIGELAVLDHQKAGEPPGAQPVFDYEMIDTSYMLAPIAGAWLLDDARGRTRAKAFLAAPSGRSGDAQETAGAALVRNLRLVLDQTRPFVEAPTGAHLLALKPGVPVGQWRDSNAGLGGGRVPYDVNAVFAPAALDAAARMYAAGLLDPYLTAADRAAFARAGEMAKAWRAKAPGYFEVTVPAGEARAQVADYAKDQGVPAAPALAALPRGSVKFHALALNADGSPVRAVNSDEGFNLLFGRPDPAALSWEVAGLMRPFPAGLMTDVGLLVATPTYADAGERAPFTRNAYHGLVVWSWQQALLAAGLDRQLARTDLPRKVRAELVRARTTLWAAIDAGKAVSNSELWSWTFRDGRYQIAPYGAAAGDADESNAAQLWSTVFLALKDPTKR